MFVLCCGGRFLLNVSLRRRRMSLFSYLYTVAIPVNYTSEFRNLFVATFSLRQFIHTSIIDGYSFTRQLVLLLFSYT